MFNTLRSWFQPATFGRGSARAADASRPRIFLQLEELEVRRVLTQVYPNVSPALEALYDSSGVTAVSASTTAASDLYVQNGDVKVSIRGKSGTSFTQLLSSLKGVGFQQVAVDDSVMYVTGWLPISKVPTVASFAGSPSVIADTKVILKSVGKYADSGQQLLKGDILQNTYNLNGAGEVIGIISDSINVVGNGVYDSYETGDLPAIGSQLEILQDGPAGSTDEGRAMAEEVHDIAPAAKIVFNTSGTDDLELSEAIQALVAAGCNIIVDDISEGDEPWFQNGLASQAVENAVTQHNVAYFSAAGNYGDSGWQSPFNGSLSDGSVVNTAPSPTFANLTGVWHNFDTSTPQATILQAVEIPPGETINVEFQFDDPTYGGQGVTRDVDIYLFDQTVTAILASGTADNVALQSPVQNFTYTNGSTTAPVFAYIGIRMASGYDIGYFQYVDFDDNLVILSGPNGIQPFAGPVAGSGIVTTTGDHSSTPDAITVGAVDELTGDATNERTSYSSYGDNVRVYDDDGNRLASPVLTLKVDILGESGVLTSLSGFRPFNGTSAAAPNVAAIAALVWEYDRGLTSKQLTDLLKNTAEPLTNPSPTLYSGLFANPDGVNLTSPNVYAGYGLADGATAVEQLAGGVLTVNGDRNPANPNDVFTISVSTDARYSNASGISLQISLNGQVLGYVRRSSFLKRIDFVGGVGDDTLVIDNSNGVVNTSFGIAFAGGSGTNTIETAGNADYSLSYDSLQIGIPSGTAGQPDTELPNIALSGVTDAVIGGGTGTDNFTLLNWVGRAAFQGKGTGDTFNLDLSHGQDNLAVTDTGKKATLNIQGAASGNGFALNLQGNEQAGHLSNGTFETVDYSGIPTVNVIGAGATSLAISDTTGTPIGSASDLKGGVVYDPTGAYSGRLTAAGTAVINAESITTGLSFNGAGDTLTVLGVTASSQKTTGFGEVQAADGSDVFGVSDSGVNIKNNTLGLLRSLAISNIANLFIEGGNQGAGQGDTYNVTISPTTNIFVDGGTETSGANNTLNVNTIGTRTTVTDVNNPALGPVGSSRIYQSYNNGSVGYQNIENVGGNSYLDSIYATAVGGSGQVATVNVYDARTNALRFSFVPFAGYQGTIKIAVGDYNGDGVDDVIVAAGPGAPPHVMVEDGKTKTQDASFYAYVPSFTGGISLAVGDVEGDGHADIVTAIDAPGAGPHVKVFSATTGATIMSFYAYDPGFQGGVSLAVSDINQDGHADIITGAGPGAGPHVKVFDGATGATIRSFYAFDASFNGGISVAAGDLDNTGDEDIVVAPLTGAGPNVKVIDAASLTVLDSFYYNTTFNPTSYTPSTHMSPVNVAIVDISGLGSQRELALSEGYGSKPQVTFYSVGANNALSQTDDFFAAGTNYGGGVAIAGTSNS